MSEDAKNSILLWVGALVFAGLFWSAHHFEVGAVIPDGWVRPILGLAFALNVLGLVRDCFRRRKRAADDR